VLFTGHEHDTETGLIYMKARFYDPDIGRFLNQDSFLGDNGTPPSLHRYLYAYSSPTVFVDPDGHAPYLDDWSKDYQAIANSKNASALQFRQQNQHAAGTSIEVGAASMSLASQSLGFANLLADAVIGTGADIGEVFGADFSKSDTVNKARRNLGSAENSLFGAVAGASKFGSAKGRAELGRPLVEWGASFAKGDDQAAQKLTNFSTQLGVGGVGLGEVALARAAGKLKTGPQITGERSGLGNGGGQSNSDIGNSVGAQADAELGNLTDQQMIDTLIETRAKGNAPGAATFAMGRNSGGTITPVRESIPHPSGDPTKAIHAEPQVLNDIADKNRPHTVAVDQQPCHTCTPKLRENNSRAIIPEDVNKPDRKTKSAAVKAAKGKTTVVPKDVEFE